MVKTVGAKDKVKRKFHHSFARQFLEDNGIRLYNGEEQILKGVGQLYPISLPNTQYLVGEQFVEQGETRKIYKFEELQSLGFVIISLGVGTRERWTQGQKVRYELRRVQETGEHIGKIPKEHYIEYDTYNKAIRLIGPRAGPLGYGNWSLMEKKGNDGRGGGQKITFSGLSKDPQKLLERQMLKWQGLEEEKQPINIPEAAFMITDSNEIVCFPNTPDMPSILISGMKGCQIGTDTVMMADGTFKPIKNIVVGDEVLSPQEDGSVIPSKVLKTTSWYCDEVYQIKELNRQKRTLYTCSYNHLIPLNKHIVPRVKGEKRLDLTNNQIRHNTAREYAKWSKGYKQQCTTLLSPKIPSFGRRNPGIDAYSLGYFIGDGSFRSSLEFVMHRDDMEIYDYLNNKEAIRTMVQEKVSRVFYSMNGKFAQQLEKLGLKKKTSGTKFIPKEALMADSEYRMNLLAGLIDSDGSLTRNGNYEYTCKSEKIIDGLLFLVKSLGGRCGKKTKVTKKAQNSFEGTYWRISFYMGDTQIPLKSQHKIKKINSMYLSPNRVSIDAKPTKPATVYGFTLDSPSSWYITNDFVVTHNTGKCIVQEKDTDWVVQTDGQLKKISEGIDSVAVLDNNMKMVNARVKETFKREVDEVVKIKTKNKSILLTPEHPLLTITGWKQAKDLEPGEFIATPRKLNLDLKGKMDPHELKLLAYFIGRGRVNNTKARFFYVDRDPELLKLINKTIKKIDKKSEIDVQTLVGPKNSKIKKLLQKHELWCKSADKKIPDIIFTLKEEQLKDFLSALYTAKGSARIAKKIEIHLENKLLARQVSNLFLRLGIITRVRRYSRPTAGRKNSYGVGIESIDMVEKFQENISPLTRHKLLQLKQVISLSPERVYTRDIIPRDVWKITSYGDNFDLRRKGINICQHSYVKNADRNIGVFLFRKLADETKDPLQKKIAYSDIYWDKITHKRELKEKHTVWDLEVDHPSHNFIANDIIVHNSFTLHSLVSRFFWKPEFDYKICILNDSSRETGTWCMPNQDPEQINILGRLNEKPLPLPTVYFHPLVKEDYEKLYMGEVGFDVTIPFRTIVMDHKKYLNLKDSTRYFTKIVDDLLKCDDQEEAERLMDDLVLRYQVPPQTANKIRAEFETLFDSKMTDISTKGQNPWSTSKNPEKVYNPFTAAVHAGLLPVLETEFVSNYRQMLSIYFTYFVGDLFNRQKQDTDFVEEQSEVMFVVDEAHNISQKGIKSGADMLLRRSVREGRPRRIGTLLATQKFNELPDVIKDNTTYLICFKNVGEAQNIATQYNLGKHMANAIRDLEKHQCMAYTTEHFIVYDSNGNKRKSKPNESFIGFSLPPYSLHKRPKAHGGEGK